MDLIKTFKQISKTDTLIAGGKGASLGEMLNAGIPVPNGFVILSTAFDRFIEENNLDVELDAILDKVRYQEMSSVENASEEIKSLILNAKMPEDIVKDVELNFKKLGAKFVAVRSSATSEDSSTAAWAGQLESYLNTTQKTLLENVKKCWASLFTPRAIFYRKEKNLHKSKISVAVVVQKMVDSECSGIAFSVHPVTKDKNQILIEAGFGLGEAIVSGAITPDSYVIEKEPRRIIDKNIAVQERGLYRSPKGGNEWKPLSKEIGEKQVLSDKEILELTKIILNIENHYGFPCDIEWAREKGKFYIVQSRPITTLTDKVNEEKNKNLAEIYIENAVKKNVELLPPLHNNSAFVQASGWNTKEFYGKYYNANLSNQLILLQDKDKSFQLVDAIVAKKPGEDFFREYLDKPSILKNREKIISENVRQIDKYYKEYTYKKIDSKSSRELIALAEKIRKIMWDTNAAVSFSGFFDKELCLRVLKEHNIETSFLDEVWPEFTKPAFPSFDAEAYLDYNKTKDVESLQYVFTTYFKAFDINYVREHLKDKFGNFDKNIYKEIESQKEKLEKIKKLLKPQEIDIATYIQKIMYLRDKRKNFFGKGITIIWRIAEKIFRECNISRELIPYTLMQELFRGEKHLISIKDELEHRKQGFAVLVPYEGEPMVEIGNIDDKIKLLNDFYLNANAPESNIIKGQTAHGGKVKGTVKIVKDPHNASHLKEGDILVTGMTRPEYVPLMRRASAIITDEGGITCHAAIVSRELKKPCIIGTKIATQFLHNGDEVEVDADRGIVKIIKRA